MTPEQKELLKRVAQFYNETKNAFENSDEGAARLALLHFDLDFGVYVSKAFHSESWRYRPLMGTFLIPGHTYSVVKLDGPGGPIWVFRGYETVDQARGDTRDGKHVKTFSIPGGVKGDVPF